ncbi:hypothetical protein GCM10009527_074170 [Actinomadura nitritigenes]
MSRTVEAVCAAIGGAADAEAGRVKGASATAPASAADTRRGVREVICCLPHAGGGNVKKIRMTPHPRCAAGGAEGPWREQDANA